MEDTFGFIVSDDTSYVGYKSIELNHFDYIKQPINQELMNKLVKKALGVQKLTIREMSRCTPALRSQLMNCAADIFDEKTLLTENRLCKYETLLEDNEDDENAPDVKTIREEIEDNKLTHIDFYNAIYKSEITDGDRNFANALANAEYLDSVENIDFGYNESLFGDAEIYENILTFFSFQK